MKKTAVHFKIAAWSIKHPVPFYAIIGSGALVLLVGLLALGRMSVPASNRIGGSIASQANDPTGTSVPPVWEVISEFRPKPNMRCIERKRKDTGFSVFSCYENQNGEWKFKHNL